MQAREIRVGRSVMDSMMVSTSSAGRESKGNMVNVWVRSFEMERSCRRYF